MSEDGNKGRMHSALSYTPLVLMVVAADVAIAVGLRLAGVGEAASFAAFIGPIVVLGALSRSRRFNPFR